MPLYTKECLNSQENFCFFSLSLFPSAPRNTIVFRFSFLFVVFRNYATSMSLSVCVPAPLAIHFPRFLKSRVKKNALILTSTVDLTFFSIQTKDIRDRILRLHAFKSGHKMVVNRHLRAPATLQLGNSATLPTKETG